MPPAGHGLRFRRLLLIKRDRHFDGTSKASGEGHGGAEEPGVQPTARSRVLVKPNNPRGG